MLTVATSASSTSPRPMMDITPFIQESAVAVADELERRGLVHAPGRFASAQNNPLGTPRAFLNAGRRGHFPTFKRGREVVAKWDEVERDIESRPVQRQPRPKAHGAVLDPNGTDERRDADRLAVLVEMETSPFAGSLQIGRRGPGARRLRLVAARSRRGTQRWTPRSRRCGRAARQAWTRSGTSSVLAPADVRNPTAPASKSRAAISALAQAGGCVRNARPTSSSAPCVRGPRCGRMPP